MLPSSVFQIFIPLFFSIAPILFSFHSTPVMPSAEGPVLKEGPARVHTDRRLQVLNAILQAPEYARASSARGQQLQPQNKLEARICCHLCLQHTLFLNVLWTDYSGLQGHAQCQRPRKNTHPRGATKPRKEQCAAENHGAIVHTSPVKLVFSSSHPLPHPRSAGIPGVRHSAQCMQC